MKKAAPCEGVRLFEMTGERLSVLLEAVAHEGLALVLELAAVGQAGLHELLAFITFFASGFGVASAHQLLLGCFGLVACSHAHAASEGHNSQDKKFFHDDLVL